MPHLYQQAGPPVLPTAQTSLLQELRGAQIPGMYLQAEGTGVFSAKRLSKKPTCTWAGCLIHSRGRHYWMNSRACRAALDVG